MRRGARRSAAHDLHDAGAAATITAESLAAAFAHALTPEARRKARSLGARVRKRDGVELVLRSLYRHLPVHAMRCATNPAHVATAYCQQCRQRLCEECRSRAHEGHRVHGYRYVDWSVRPERSMSGALRGVRDRALGGRTVRGATWKAPRSRGT